MHKFGRAVICSGFESGIQVCADRLFLKSFGFLWDVSNDDTSIIFYDKKLEGACIDDAGKLSVVLSDGVHDIESGDVKARPPEPTQAGLKSVLYGDVLHVVDGSGYPVAHSLKDKLGNIIFEAKERYLDFLGYVGGGFIFYRRRNRELFSVGADGGIQQLYQFDDLTHIRCVGDLVLLSVQLADGQSRCDVYDLNKRSVVDRCVVGCSSDSFSSVVEAFGAWAFLWSEELFLIRSNKLIRAFPERKVRSYLPVKEGVYVAFADEPVLYLYDGSLSYVQASLDSPDGGYRFSSMQPFANGLACYLYRAEKITGLSYVLFLREALGSGAVEVECEERLFEYEKRSKGASFTYVARFAHDVQYDTLVRQAIAAVDEAFSYFSESNPETLEFDGHVEVVLDGGALSQKQKLALLEACNEMAQRYFYRNSPVTGDAFNVSVNFSE
ncbi:hypothetical protein [Pseudomonas solani]|uniref:hypothetical protein n=1 Tax=Pseudomonas solani TaxID=2731552 RepID=UPI003D6BCC78